MKEFNILWKSFIKEVNTSMIFETLFASLFYSLFIIIPTILIYAQIISMYYHLLNLWIGLIIISVIFIHYFQLILWKKAIYLKKDEVKTNINKLFMYQLFIDSIIIVIIGLLFIFIFIPMMQI
ncbi:MAG: hypothetical protein K9L64_03480 [Candidatus Izimaplasma sp.]|nr:hypothetical protein [Candidatus Izimaplasma bacterium]